MNTGYVRLLVVLLAVLLLGSSRGISPREVQALNSSISGTVVDAQGVVSGAHVRVRAAQDFTLTGSSGEFTLEGIDPGVAVEVTAWADGYYVTSTQVIPPASGITLTLRRYHTVDHPDYAWVSPEPGSSEKACGNCHPLILPQWENNAHGKAVTNDRFYSMYNGTDLAGSLPVAPGYLDDFPGTAGSCASCHAPGAAVDGYLITSMNDVRAELTAGIHCDFCHKVGGVFLDPGSENVYPNAPGANSQLVLRPPVDDQIFFGPYDDVPDPDTYLPQISESSFCAPCHQFSFWGTPIYESYTEWLESSYPAAGITCQKCHMPPNGDEMFALPEVGGLVHPPEDIPSHQQLGAESLKLLQAAVKLSASLRQVGDRIEIVVEITNTNTGHHVPTDHPGRHLILTVEALDQESQVLPYIFGPEVPSWGGDQAGLPGKAYAKVLRDVASGESPVVSYWKRTSLVSDNRLPAGGSDRTTYTFLAPPVGETVAVSIQLRFRRLFQEDLQAKDWGTPDVIMEEAALTGSVELWWQNYLPLVIEH